MLPNSHPIKLQVRAHEHLLPAPVIHQEIKEQASLRTKHLLTTGLANQN
jgi:DNA recombination-dependent growth factor C